MFLNYCQITAQKEKTRKKKRKNEEEEEEAEKHQLRPDKTFFFNETRKGTIFTTKENGILAKSHMNLKCSKEVFLSPCTYPKREQIFITFYHETSGKA